MNLLKIVGLRGVVIEETQKFYPLKELPLNFLTYEQLQFVADYDVYSEICVLSKENIEVFSILEAQQLNFIKENSLLRSEERNALWFSLLLVSIDSGQFEEIELCVFFKLSDNQLQECRKIMIDNEVENA